MTERFVAAAEDAGLRIDVVLARRAGVARTAAQKALAAGKVTVAGRIARSSHRLLEGEPVEAHLEVAGVAPPGPENIPVVVRYEDERVLVVSKPAGLVTHPAGGHETGTLVNALIGLGGPLAHEGSDRPGIVHRLDKDTSGLLLVARDESAHAFLVAALKDHRVERRYLALVRGRPQAPSGTIDARVGRHPQRRRLMAVTPSGRPAVTHYKVVESFSAPSLASSGPVSLLEVTLETGRTHQIRVHLAHLGHPILGDGTYGGASPAAAALGLGRPFLHARALSFPHPGDGRTISVTDPLPPDLATALPSHLRASFTST